MKMKNVNYSKTFVMLAIVCSVMLAGCGNVRKSLGVEREAPDEFAVLTRAPLEMPPNLALPPPQPGMPRPQEQAPAQMARQAIFGQDAVQQASSVSAAEASILQQAGQASDPNIRSVVDYEATKTKDSNRTVAQRLFGLGGSKASQPSATIVDPKAEAERIQKNIEAGKPVTSGVTPSVEE